ncbi:glycoside hydrolase family 31 protein [Undibacterium sp. TS12]|uniref:glycoside hydrolase family 31 protein n=1 Tax=Undibacterium sp. TS12 TaxID=2908202 RepID=UPI001F4D336A|nr:glycoside hydrolase family 31 protein [Undibacterium sp. TS12]
MSRKFLLLPNFTKALPVLLCSAGLLLVTNQGFAQPVMQAGKLTSLVRTADGIAIETEHAHVALTVFSPGVIRVRMDKKALGADFSYAVIAKPGKTDFQLNELEDILVLKTAALQVKIQKRPFSVRFETPDGILINQDEPGLSNAWIGDEVSSYKTLQEGERFIGLGEKTGNLDRRGSAYTNWNTDAFRYSGETDPLYASIPFYIGIHHGMSYGIFFDNSYQTDFNFGASNKRFSSFSAQGGELDYYFIFQPRVADIIHTYTELTGRMPLPPLWSLGYQQNRWSYYPEAEVMRIAHTLREKKIPADGITLDIHYMDGYRVFTWDKQAFSNPRGMVDKLADLGFKTTVIVDPGIKIDPDYATYVRGMQQNVFLRYADGTPYSGEVWPGWVHFPDFTRAATRAWWQAEVASYAKQGVAGLWNDMNEISTWGQKTPNNILFDYDGHITTHKQGRNVYALQMARASHEGMKQATGERPFILSRSGYAGLQRYAAIWTGDNTADEEHMLLGIRLLNSLGLSGMPFTGMDIGGFTGTPTPGLYARWMQIGAFTPYFRNHAASDSRSSEPWTYGEDVLNISRNYINLRYQLIPYLYSCFYQAATSGMPIMRSLAIDYTHDEQIYSRYYQNQYMFGDAFLVAPFASSKEFGRLYLPQGDWYDLYSDQLEHGRQAKALELHLERLPVYVKAGSIVTTQSLIQSTAQQPDDTLFIHIYHGPQGSSVSYYEDDGKSYDYQNGQYYKRQINFIPEHREIQFGAVEGKHTSKFHKLKILLHGFHDVGSVELDDKTLPVSMHRAGFLGKGDKELNLPGVTIANSAGKITLKY